MATHCIAKGLLWAPMSPNIAQYRLISSNIAQYHLLSPNIAYYYLTSLNTAYATWEWTRLFNHLVMVYDNIHTLVYCLQTLATIDFSFLEYSDEYTTRSTLFHTFRFTLLRPKRITDLPIVQHIFCESNYI